MNAPTALSIVTRALCLLALRLTLKLTLRLRLSLVTAVAFLAFQSQRQLVEDRCEKKNHKTWSWRNDCFRYKRTAHRSIVAHFRKESSHLYVSVEDKKSLWLGTLFFFSARMKNQSSQPHVREVVCWYIAPLFELHANKWVHKRLKRKRNQDTLPTAVL